MITFIEHPIVSEKCDHYEIMVNGKKANAVKTRVSAMLTELIFTISCLKICELNFHIMI